MAEIQRQPGPEAQTPELPRAEQLTAQPEHATPAAPASHDQVREEFLQALDGLPVLKKIRREDEGWLERVEDKASKQRASELYDEREQHTATLEVLKAQSDHVREEIDKQLASLAACNLDSRAGRRQLAEVLADIGRLASHGQITQENATRIHQVATEAHYAYGRKYIKEEAAADTGDELVAAVREAERQAEAADERSQKLSSGHPIPLVGNWYRRYKNRDDIAAAQADHARWQAEHNRLSDIRKHSDAQRDRLDEARWVSPALLKPTEAAYRKTAETVGGYYQTHIETARQREAATETERILPESAIDQLNDTYFAKNLDADIARLVAQQGERLASAPVRAKIKMDALTDPEAIAHLKDYLRRSYALPTGCSGKEYHALSPDVQAELRELGNQAQQLDQYPELTYLKSAYHNQSGVPSDDAYRQLGRLVDILSSDSYQLEQDYRQVLEAVRSKERNINDWTESIVSRLTSELGKVSHKKELDGLLAGPDGKGFDAKRWAALRDAQLDTWSPEALDRADQFLATTVAKELLTKKEHTKESIVLGEKLFEFHQPETAAITVLNAFREPGNSGEYPFITMTAGSQAESPLVHWIAALDPEKMAAIEQVGIPGLTMAIETIRENPDNFARSQTLVDDKWLDNPAHAQLTDSLETAARHLLTTNPDTQKYLMGFFSRIAYQRDLRPETMAAIGDLYRGNKNTELCQEIYRCLIGRAEMSNNPAALALLASEFPAMSTEEQHKFIKDFKPAKWHELRAGYTAGSPEDVQFDELEKQMTAALAQTLQSGPEGKHYELYQKLLTFPKPELAPLALLGLLHSSDQLSQLQPGDATARTVTLVDFAQRLSETDLQSLSEQPVPGLAEALTILRNRANQLLPADPEAGTTAAYNELMASLETFAQHALTQEPSLQKYTLEGFRNLRPDGALSATTLTKMTEFFSPETDNDVRSTAYAVLNQRARHLEDRSAFVALAQVFPRLTPNEQESFTTSHNLLDWTREQMDSLPEIRPQLIEILEKQIANLAAKPTVFIERMDQIAALYKRLPDLKRTAWYDSYVEIRGMQGQAAHADYDPWKNNFDPLVSKALTSGLIDTANPADGKNLEQFVKHFGMYLAPEILRWQVAIARRDAGAALPEDLGTAMASFGIDPKLPLNDFLEAMTHKRAELLQTILDDRLPDAGYDQPITNDLMEMLRNSNEWKRGEQFLQLAQSWRSTVEQKPELAQIPDAYQQPPFEIHAMSEAALSERSTRHKQEVLTNRDVQEMVTLYRQAYESGQSWATAAEGKLPEQWQAATHEVNAVIEQSVAELENHEFNPSVVADPLKLAKAQGQRQQQIANLRELGANLAQVNLENVPTAAEEQDAFTVDLIEQIAGLERQLKLQGKVPQLDRLLRTISAMHTVQIDKTENGFGPTTKQLLTEPSTTTEPSIRGWAKLITERMNEHYLHPEQKKHHVGHKPFSKLARQRLADAWRLPKAITDNQIVLARNRLDEIEASTRSISEETISVDLVPVRGIGRIYSGDFGSACYTSRHHELARGEYPNLAAFLFVTGKATGNPEIRGSVLAIETETPAGEKTLLVRANNPQQKFLLEVDSNALVEQTLNRMIAVAEARGMDKVVVPIDATTASSSNRGLVTDGYYKPHFTDNEKTDLKNEPATNFNGYKNYDSGPNGNPCVVIWTKEKGKIGFEAKKKNPA